MTRDDSFNFEEWLLLAKSDPEAFELRRRRFLDSFILASGKKHGLGKCLQREIDDVRARAETPEAALKAIAAMMFHQLAFLGEGLGELKSRCDELTAIRNQLMQVHARGVELLKLTS